MYILEDSNGKLYKGMTGDFQRRLKEHRCGGTITTSRMGKFRVVYTEQFEKIDAARKRELYFKSAAGRRFLKKVLPPGP
ncbi:MAG: GIY-YIG nuclease family protein [Candidatus Brennerbacteria bacterium]